MSNSIPACWKYCFDFVFKEIIIVPTSPRENTKDEKVKWIIGEEPLKLT